MTLNFRTSFLLIILLLQRSVVYSRWNDEYVIKQLKIKDGLSQSSILTIIQDKRGFMWFGTASGLNKYDGHSFKVYTYNSQDSLSLSDNGISSLYEDADGYIWVGTTGGFLNRFDRKTDTFRRINLSSIDHSSGAITDDYFNYPLLYSRFNNYSVTTISEDKKGRIWIGTWGRGIYILNKKNETISNHSNNPKDEQSLSFNRITKILCDRNGNMWIATFGGGLNKVEFTSNTKELKNKIHFKCFKNIARNKSSLNDDKVVTLFEDKGGSLWIGTFYGGLNKLDEANKNSSADSIVFTYLNSSENKESNLSHNSIMAIAEDNSNFIWLGTFGDGLKRFDLNEKTILNFQHENFNDNSIADNDIISLYSDNSGLLWVGTHLGEGISRLEKKILKFDLIKSNSNKNSGLNDDVVWSILKDRSGVLWIGTYRGGLNYYNEKTNKFGSYKHDPHDVNSLSSNHVRCLAEDNSGNLWVGTYAGGLNKFNKATGKFTRYIHDKSDPFSIGGNQIQRLFIDSNSILWIAVFGGGLNILDLKHQSKAKPNFIKYRNDPLDSTSLSEDRVYTIYEDKQKNIWLGTFGGGLNRFVRDTKKFERFRFDQQNQFSSQIDNILCLHEDKSGNLWIGTYGKGLVKFDIGSKKFVNYDGKKNIDADAIYGILEDDNKNLWLSSSNGIYKFSYETELASRYDIQDGVQSLEFNGGAYFKAPDGEMFLGGINGMNRFQPLKIKYNEFIPSVVITSIKVANHFVNGEVDSLELNYHENFLTFEFASLSYLDPQDNSYSYKLEGFDDDWKSADAKYRMANYTNLPPGEYLFKIKAAGRNGIWSANEAQLYILINPPFWRTLWFIGFAILLVSAAIYYLGSLRSRNQLVIEKLKTKLAADLHDNVGSGLTEISILSELVKKGIDTPHDQNVRSSLKNISEISRQLIDNMSDIVWVVNPKRDSLHDLLVRLKDSYSDIFSSYGISFKIINLDQLDNLSLPMEYRQNLYLIFKEGINNAIKYSNCKKMTLEANVRGNVLELTLSDDGVGLDLESVEYGNGIKNIETRAQLIDGKLKWKSSSNNGTTIRFIGKIKKTKKSIWKFR